MVECEPDGKLLITHDAKGHHSSPNFKNWYHMRLSCTYFVLLHFFYDTLEWPACLV